MVAFTTFGGDMVAVFNGRTSLQAGGSKAGTELQMTVNDLDFLRAEVPGINRMSPEENKQNSLIAYGTRNGNYTVRGTYSVYQRIRNIQVSEGAFYGDQEDFSHTRVAVLGYDVRRSCFRDRPRLEKLFAWMASPSRSSVS